MGKPWDASVTVLQGVGSVREKALERMGIRTLGDLLMTFPRGYCDVAGGGGLAGAQPGALTAALVRAVSSPVTLRPRPGLTLVRCDVQGDGRRAQCLWYNQPWIAQQLHAGEDYLAIGRADFQQGTLRLLSPDMEPWQGQDFPPVLPLYPLTRGLSQRIFRSLTAQALRRVVGSLPDPLPAAFRRTYGLCERNYALEHAHYPATLETCRAARERLALEEMLLYMLALGDARARRAQEGLAPALPASEGLLEALRQGLGFPLTGAQERVLGEVLSDMAGTRPMNRMVQGDVGSGKTAVALMALAVAAGNGRQGALMAPTEILAAQLYQGACQLLEPLGFRVGLLTGSMKAGEKRQARAAIAQGEWDVAVGTHALIQGDVAFHDLALVVTDEQHRLKQGDISGQPGGLTLVLVLLGASHERRNAAVHIATLVEHVIQFTGNRHGHTGLLCHVMSCLGRVISLDNRADLLHGLLDALALTDQDTGTAVTRVHGRTGNDQVTHTGQTGKGLLLGTQRHAQACNLSQSAGH